MRPDFAQRIGSIRPRVPIPITPDGNVFFPVALSHLYSGESNVACENVYAGDKDTWMKGAFAKARAMGFNCALGSATSPERNLNGFVEIPKVEAVFRENNFPFAVGVIPFISTPILRWPMSHWQTATAYKSRTAARRKVR